MSITAQQINHWGRLALNKLATGQQYTSWSDEMCRNDGTELLRNIQEYINEQGADFSTMTHEKLKEFGFKAWDEPDDNGDVLMLAPLWVVPCFKEGTVLTSISGNTATVGVDEIDKDERFGCIAYGVLVKAQESPTRAEAE